MAYDNGSMNGHGKIAGKTHPFLLEGPPCVRIKPVSILILLRGHVVLREVGIVEDASPRRDGIDVFRLQTPAVEQQVGEARLLVQRRKELVRGRRKLAVEVALVDRGDARPWRA